MMAVRGSEGIVAGAAFKVGDTVWEKTVWSYA